MTFVQRLHPVHRVLHVFMALSFLGLVASGMPLRYSHAPWADWLIGLMGGYRGAGLVHRVCAVVTFGYFLIHILYVIYDIAIVRRFKFAAFGPESMVPGIKDIKDIYSNIKWFLGEGPAPQFDRWTYWEKFDYWAVFWGVGMIGVSGLLLWFPEFFGRFLPGWAFNIATIIHSDEALLASGFIFTIHFFNTHLRPEKFPMDTVIFTGKLSVEELRRERPEEYRRLVEGKNLEKYEASAPSVGFMLLSSLFGFAIVAAGFFLLALIVIGQFFY
jgi:cytochrome b subunit of formate dehydrogenase